MVYLIMVVGIADFSLTLATSFVKARVQSAIRTRSILLQHWDPPINLLIRSRDHLVCHYTIVVSTSHIILGGGWLKALLTDLFLISDTHGIPMLIRAPAPN